MAESLWCLKLCVHACTRASVCLRACVYACVCVHVCPSNTVPNNLWLPPSLVFYQSALSNHYSHLCLSANMLFPPSLFPPPQRDKVKECCISTSKLNSSMLSECFFFPPLWHRLLSSAEWKRHFAVDFFFFFCLCPFARTQTVGPHSAHWIGSLKMEGIITTGRDGSCFSICSFAFQPPEREGNYREGERERKKNERSNSRQS